MARFLVMPGLNDLIDAFSRIPEGPMRVSVIHMAKTLADQYSSAPAEYRAADPLALAASTAPPGGLTQLPEPKVPKIPKALDGPEADVIRRRKKGQHPQQIAEETGIYRAEVAKIIAEAKKAGVKFQNIRGAHGRPLEHKEWHTSLSTMTGQGLSRVQAAALARGISPEEYLKRKMLAVDMAMKGAHYPAIETATHTDSKTISLWLSNARAAGLKVPYVEHAERPQEAPSEPVAAKSNIIRPSRFYGPWSAVQHRHKTMIAKAAERRSITPEAYLDLQESVVRQRMQGVAPLEIAKATGESEVFIKDTLAHAKKELGAKFPPCPKGWSAKRATA
jgi:biotin operon repressor